MHFLLWKIHSYGLYPGYANAAYARVSQSSCYGSDRRIYCATLGEVSPTHISLERQNRAHKAHNSSRGAASRLKTATEIPVFV